MTPRKPAAPRGVRLLSLGALPLVAGLALATPGPTAPLAPDIPPQPGTAAVTCARAADRPGTWRELTHMTGGTTADAVSFQVQVDPWEPCLMYRATSGQDLQRSVNSGRTWSAVFHDEAGTGGVAPVAGVTSFAAQDVQVPGPRRLVLAEGGNGDAVVASADAGATWQLADSGIEGQAIQTVVPAPGHPDVIYATTGPLGTQGPGPSGIPLGLQRPGVLAIYVTRDGGRSWTPATLPALVSATASDNGGQAPPRTLQVQVDPDDPAHLWVMVEHLDEQGAAGTVILLESTDFGQTWAPPIAPKITANQFLAIRSPTHGLRLYLNDFTQSSGAYLGVPVPMVSSNDGRTWAPLPVDPLGYASLAVNPANPDELIYAGVDDVNLHAGGASQIDYYVTYDSWDSARSGPPLTGLRGAYQAQSPLKHGPTDDATVLAQGDRYGGFYLLIDQFCVEGFASLGTAGAKCFDDEHRVNPTDDQFYRQSLYRLTPLPPPPRAGGGGGDAGSPLGLEMAAIKTCPIPIVETHGQDQSGPLSYDGQSLLYTLLGETGAAPFQGVVHRMDPVTCAETTPLPIEFNPADLALVARYDAFPDEAVHPYVDTLTYDANHDVLWVSLRTARDPGTSLVGSADSSVNNAAVFSVAVTRAPGLPPAGRATLRFFTPDQADFGNGADLLAYDFGDDTIWTTYPYAYGNNGVGGLAGHRTADGAPIPSCWANNTSYGEIATWVIGGPSRLYVQSENDQTIWEVDGRSCAEIQRYHHRSFGEPIGEDEQMACDSLTFGPGSGFAAGNRATSAIWLRDAINQTVVAYALPDSTCPFPTVTRFLGQHEVIQGDVATLCAGLARAGLLSPLAGLPLDFRLGGRYVGTATTGAGGVACLKAAVTLGGGNYLVDATFAGTPQYRGSHGAGPLTVDVLSVPGLAPLSLAPFVPPGGVFPQPPGLTVNVSVPTANGQTAAQANAQPQPLSISQGQPVAVSEPQSQPQHQAAMALQSLGQEQENGQYAMVTARHRTSLPEAAGIAVGSMAFWVLVGCALAWAPRPAAVARVAARRRPPRAGRPAPPGG